MSWCYILFSLEIITFQMFGVSNFFLKDINTFIQQGCIVLIKSDSEDIYNVSISNKLCFLTFYSKNPKKKKKEPEKWI